MPKFKKGDKVKIIKKDSYIQGVNGPMQIAIDTNKVLTITDIVYSDRAGNRGGSWVQTDVCGKWAIEDNELVLYKKQTIILAED